ncbi:hypothetical protein CPHO_12000 [Corynebacterium phocae]|uniref:Uncharacterized protein n=1 Tax=Corynebacterium phocae TaxID=161895 RepID=A0A1L7D671_9CORY|nr:hypothetical protein CPHO_12000 [Corynebacterium phocae]
MSGFAADWEPGLGGIPFPALKSPGMDPLSKPTLEGYEVLAGFTHNVMTLWLHSYGRMLHSHTTYFSNGG